jgi:hypothetical protein
MAPLVKWAEWHLEKWLATCQAVTAVPLPLDRGRADRIGTFRPWLCDPCLCSPSQREGPRSGVFCGAGVSLTLTLPEGEGSQRP